MSILKGFEDLYLQRERARESERENTRACVGRRAREADVPRGDGLEAVRQIAVLF